MCSVVEGTEQCHVPLDPVVLRLAGGNLHRHHIVSGVASSGESAWERGGGGERMREGGSEGRREGGKEGGGGGRREGGREGEREGGREGGKEGGIDRQVERWREEEKEK